MLPFVPSRMKHFLCLSQEQSWKPYKSQTIFHSSQPPQAERSPSEIVQGSYLKACMMYIMFREIVHITIAGGRGEFLTLL